MHAQEEQPTLPSPGSLFCFLQYCFEGVPFCSQTVKLKYSFDTVNEMLPGLYSSGKINSLVHVDDRGGRRRYYSILSFVELLFYYNLHFEKKFKVIALYRHLITRVGTFFCPNSFMQLIL